MTELSDSVDALEATNANLITLLQGLQATLQNAIDAGQGPQGWSPVFTVQSDGERRVFQVSDWINGGTGVTKPATGEYLGAAGLVATAAEAVDVRGDAGASAYEDWIEAGNTGTFDDFIDHLSDLAVTATASNRQDALDARDQTIAARDTTLGYVSQAAGHVTAAAQEAANATANSSGQDLSGLSETLGPSAILGAFIYDTALDSDGGAWRFKCGWTSWEREDRPTGSYLGIHNGETPARAAEGSGTGAYYFHQTSEQFFELSAGSGQTEIFRGSDQQFPAKALITFEDDRVIIWNALTGAMWMVFSGGARGVWGLSSRPINSLSCINGQMAVGSAGTNGALDLIGFPDDSLMTRINNGIAYWPGKVFERNLNASTGPQIADYFSDGIVNRNVLSLAQTVLPDAPINAETGLPYVTTVVGTQGGLTILDGPVGVGTAVDITYTGGTGVISQTTFRSDGALVYAGDNSAFGKWIHVRHSLPEADVSEGSVTIKGTSDELYVITGPHADLAIRFSSSDLSSTVSLADAAIARENGIHFLLPNPASPSNGAQIVMRDDNISPVMHGGTLFAGLASTDDTDLVGGTDPDRSPQANDLTVTGTITRTKVATGADLVGYGGFSPTNRLELPYDADFDFGLGDFSVSTWLKTSAIGDFVLDARDPANTEGFGMLINGSGLLQGFTRNATTSITTGVTAVNDDEWHLVNFVVSDTGTVQSLFIDTSLDAQATVTARNVGGTNDVSQIGNAFDLNGGVAWAGDLALLSILPKALTAEQIKLKYNIERWWFQRDAVVTLDTGTVRWVDYDKALNQYHVITSGGHSVFDARTLTRLSFTAGDWDWVTADNGSVVKGD